MHINREALYDEYKPQVQEWAAKKAARMKRDNKLGTAIVDENALEGEALNALKRAVDQWPGAGEFLPYLRRSIRNAWGDGAKKEHRHRHSRYPGSPGENDDGNEGGGCRSSAGNFAADPMVIVDGEGRERDTPVFRMKQRGFQGNSVVLMAVMKKEEAEAILTGGLVEFMRLFGCQEDEIKDAVREKNRRWQMQDRRHPDIAERRDPEVSRRRFNDLFREPSNVA